MAFCWDLKTGVFFTDRSLRDEMKWNEMNNDGVPQYVAEPEGTYPINQFAVALPPLSNWCLIKENVSLDEKFTVRHRHRQRCRHRRRAVVNPIIVYTASLSESLGYSLVRARMCAVCSSSVQSNRATWQVDSWRRRWRSGSFGSFPSLLINGPTREWKVKGC